MQKKKTTNCKNVPKKTINNNIACLNMGCVNKGDVKTVYANFNTIDTKMKAKINLM